MQNYIELTRQEYNNLLKEERDWKYYNNFATYLKEHQEESGDYLRLQPYEVNTLSRIYIDSCCSFIYNNHPLWMYVECQINEEIDKLPISISKYPQLLINCNINEEQQRIVDSAKTFIIKNTSVLEMYALENMDIIDFFKAIRTKQTLSESLLIEMPKLGKGEGYIIPQERFADNTNHTIYISCSVTDDRLWFMTNDNNQNTKQLMIEIGNTEPFEFFDKYTVYVDLNKHIDVVANIFNLGEIIKKFAKKYNLDVALTNINSIIKSL